MTGDYTILVAVAAGVLSFLSPCVLPLVPAYLGQLSAVAVATEAARPTPAAHAGEHGAEATRIARPGRWTALRHALAFVLGFGSVFTLLGVTAAFAAGAIADLVPALRVVGGVVLVVMGLTLAGILRIPQLERTWRPLDAGAGAGLATMTGGMVLSPAGAGAGAGMGTRMGSRLLAGRAGHGASFMLGAVFAVGWTPCIGFILGGILTLAATAEGKLQGALLLAAYSGGLGVPFLLMAAFYDRSSRFVRALARHGRLVSLVGGLLVVAIGLAMVFDLLVLLPRYFQFTSLV